MAQQREVSRKKKQSKNNNSNDKNNNKKKQQRTFPPFFLSALHFACAFVDERTCVENVNKLFSVQRFASNDNIKFLTNVAICTLKLKAPANGLRNIVGCYMLCPVCTSCCMLLRVVGSCFAKFDTSQTFS